jgi:hypothetical protein
MQIYKIYPHPKNNILKIVVKPNLEVRSVELRGLKGVKGRKAKKPIKGLISRMARKWW